MSDTPDLKPCPFCGGDKNTICKTDYEGRDSFTVSCRYPVCHGVIFMLGYGYFPTADQAIAAWNTRAVDPATIREAALREAAKLCDRYDYLNAQGIKPIILELIGEKNANPNK